VRVLIVFATTEGHTRKLAEFAAARLRRSGHQVRVCDAAQSEPPDPAAFAAALLMASVHLGGYQGQLRDFVRHNHAVLNAMPSAFVSASLSAAGDNPSDRAGLRDCVERLKRDTSWYPGAVYHAAGAMPFSAYGLLKKLAIKLIARRRGKIVKISEDYDLTDYAAFGDFIDSFAASAISSARRPAAAAQ
jgi:menaquinone-dependent protoporphyrinogen oxidase